MSISVLFTLLSCTTEVKAPSCESTEDGACFKGVFRTLLGQPVQDVKVCVLEDSEIPCVTSDESGQWKIPGLPLDSNIALTAEHSEYVSSLFGQHTSMAWYDWYKVGIPPNIMETNANQLDMNLSTEKGNVLFLTWEGLNVDGVDTDNIEGVTAEVDGGGQLFYANGLGLASKDATETSGSGSGGLLNIEPGEVAVKLSAQAGVCAQEHMFHYAVESEWIAVPVRAGFTTAIDVICPVD